MEAATLLFSSLTPGGESGGSGWAGAFSSDKPPRQRPDPEAAAKPVTSRVRCLIVDDDPGILTLLRRWLEAEGVEVQTVGSASTARDLVLQQEFHAVVTDMVMDGVDGIELLRHLKQAKVRPKVIGISGVAGGENLGRALLAMGGEGFLMKPFERSDLIEALEAALGRPLRAA